MKPVYRNYFALTLLALCIGLPSSYAMHHYNMSEEDLAKWEQKKEEKWNAIYEKLELNEEQITRIKAHKEGALGAKKAIRTQMKDINEALRRELDAPQSNRDEVERLVTQIGDLSAKKARMRAERVLAMKEILTDEQFAELQKHKAEMKAQRKEKWGKKKAEEE